jgi:AcrR family transcriptional regulator
MATRAQRSSTQAAPRPLRRSQAERSATTREKVIQAVTDCIVEEGLASTTASRIAQRSGVTWGAIVHQFGDKDSLLLAVMRRGFDQMSDSLHEALARGATTPRERVCLLVDETWKGLNAPSFRAFLEIILHGRLGGDAELMSRQEDIVVSLTRRLWTELFGELELEPGRLDVARKLTSATLLGMAIQGMMGPRRPRFTRELATLKENVLHMLGLD